MKKLSIIIPVYNEKTMISNVIKTVLEKKTPEWYKEIIVIDDGSTDGTHAELKKWQKKITVVLNKKNQGKGAALRQGFAKATGDVVLIQDADFEYTPDDYDALLKPFSNPRVSVVYGSRFLGSHLSTMLLYTWGNKLVTLLTNIIFNSNLTDMETGYKLFNREILPTLNLKSNKFDIEAELTAKLLKHGYQIYEVPINYFGRKFEEGKKLTWKDGIGAFWTLLKYRFVD